MQKWFWNRTETPLGEVLALRSYARAINARTSNRGHEIVRFSPSELGFSHIRLSQEGLTIFFRRYIVDLTNHLAQHLCFGFDVFHHLSRQISLERYSEGEDFVNISKGFNFLTDIDQSHRFEGFLIKHALEHHQAEWVLSQPRYSSLSSLYIPYIYS